MSRQETLEQFGCCWEGLEDPRCGNAARHDELLMIALCSVRIMIMRFRPANIVSVRRFHLDHSWFSIER
jgi:hypothetical protein